MKSDHPFGEQRESSVAFSSISLVVLLLCASFFVVYYSNSAYSSDEVWSVKAASLNYASEMAFLKADVHPPLYYQILHVWVRLFGTGERAVRSLSALFYLLSVYALYGLGRALYGNKTALLCATLYLTSPLAVLSGQFARMYALLSLISILSTRLYLQFSIKPNASLLLFVLYIVVNILGTFTHIAFFFVVFGQIVFHLLFFRQKRIRSFLVAVVLSLVPYLLLWAPILMRQIGNSAEGLAWLKRPGLSRIAELLLVYGGAFWILVPALLFTWWRTGFESFRRSSKLGSTTLPLWLLAITILTPLLISQFKPIFNSRFAIIGLHLFALTIGPLMGKVNTYLFCVALIVLNAIALSVVHTASVTCDNRAMAVYLTQNTNDGDVVIFTSLTRLPIDYYLHSAQTGRNLFEISFPSEIDNHPGYEGSIADPRRRVQLEREAGELIDKIAKMQSARKGLRIFFFHGFRPELDSLVDGRLRERFELLPAQGVQCETSSYFKKVSVYR